MMTRKLLNFCLQRGVAPTYLMEYSKGHIYKISDTIVWATNGYDGDTYWVNPNPYLEEDLKKLVDMLETTDVLKLFENKKSDSENVPKIKSSLSQLLDLAKSGDVLVSEFLRG